jgi:hypothetical protein
MFNKAELKSFTTALFYANLATTTYIMEGNSEYTKGGKWSLNILSLQNLIIRFFRRKGKA